MHDTLTRESEEYGWESMSDNVYDFNAEELAMNDDYYNYLTKQKEKESLMRTIDQNFDVPVSELTEWTHTN